ASKTSSIKYSNRARRFSATVFTLSKVGFFGRAIVLVHVRAGLQLRKARLNKPQPFSMPGSVFVTLSSQTTAMCAVFGQSPRKMQPRPSFKLAVIDQRRQPRAHSLFEV